MRYGITFNGMDPLEVMLGYAMLAEDSGLDSIWMAEHFCWRDAVTCCTAFLTSTRRITVVPTALSPYARHPMLIAMSAATMEELSPCHLKLLLGTGEPTAMGEIGLAIRRPLRTMREAVEITRELLKGDFVHYEGQVFNIKGAKMGFSPRRRVPILMAAIGPKMLRLAGAIAHGVEVEVDEETGELKIIKYAAAQDLGRVINPFAIENQMEGGIVQGVGFALSEELVYDNGRLINPTFIDYMVPRAADSPKSQLMMIETVDPEGPFGAKGAGEPGLAPVAAAIANALDDAVGVRIKELPITREKIFYSLRSKAE